MPRMPDANDLPTAQGISPGVPRQMRDFIGPAIENFGNALAGAGDRLDAQSRVDRSQEDALDLARARAAWTKGSMELNATYDTATKPDYGKWGEDYQANIAKVRDQASGLIKNPKLREKFSLETTDDVTRNQLAVTGKAKDLDRSVKLEEAQQGIDAMAGEYAGATGQDERNRITMKAWATIDNLEKTGVIDPAQAMKVKQGFGKRAEKLQAAYDLQNDPKSTLDKLKGSGDKTANVLRRFEGFSAKAYWDVNANRVGYGSDTVTRADGSVERVTKDTVVSRADAERDLARRAKIFASEAAKDVGPAWQGLSEDQRAALTSVAYNYGSLPSRVVKSIRTGDSEVIANAVESLADHNGGVNRKRREEEAAIIRGTEAAPNGEASYPLLDPEDRLTMIKSAESMVAAQDTAEREGMAQMAADEAVKLGDAKSAYAALATIPDPDIRKKAEGLADAQLRRAKDVAEQQTSEAYSKSYDGVIANLTDPKAAVAAIDPGLPAEKRETLRKLALDGPPRKDDYATETNLTGMWVRDPAAFAGTDLTAYLDRLTPATIVKMRGWQTDFQKDKAGSPDRIYSEKRAAVNSAADIVTRGLDQIGVVTGAKATPQDAKIEAEIMAMAGRRVEALTEKLKRQPLESEIDVELKDMWKTVAVTRPGRFWGTNVEDFQIDDVLKVYDDAGYDADEAQRALATNGFSATVENLLKYKDALDQMKAAK